MNKIFFTLILGGTYLFSQAQEVDKSRLAELLMIQGEDKLSDRLSHLSKSLEERDNMLVYDYYMHTAGEKHAETIKTTIINKFPKGDLAIQEQIIKINLSDNVEEKDRTYQELLKQYPKAKVIYDFYAMATGFAAQGNVSKVKQYIDLYLNHPATDKTQHVDKEKMQAALGRLLSRRRPTEALPYLEAGIAYTKGLVPPVNTAATDREKFNYVRAQQAYQEVALDYVKALIASGNVEKAYQIAAAIYQETIANTDEDDIIVEGVKQILIESLLATNRPKDALILLENSFKKTAKISKSLEANLKLAYEGVYGSTGYDNYKQKLESQKEDFALESLTKTAISDPAPDFELKDVDGNTVRLSDLKGKVVVLDFWATWCGPCKASFPAMQKAVDKYKADPNVQFLFLHTWERGSDDATVAAKQYIIENNYTFRTLMDLRDADTKDSAVAKAYKVTGIPAKFIIDPKGNIRFSKSGFSADEDKAVKELSTMIEFAKKG